ncbi:MAG TPA: PIN domain-containing protein [Thermoplasmata archaeon]|nr:PIN domain-containing protein [Thermoplasmata archaeon]
MIAIVDSFAWIELLAGTEYEAKVREILGKSEVVATPDLVLAEVARKLGRDGVSSAIVRRKLVDISTLSQVTPISPEIAIGVFQADADLRSNAKSKGLNKPGLSDAIILSTARVLHGTVLTGDPHFQGFPETSWMGN